MIAQASGVPGHEGDANHGGGDDEASQAEGEGEDEFLGPADLNLPDDC